MRDTPSTQAKLAFFDNLRYGARSLRRSPGFSITAIAVLALAMGAGTAMFSVIEGVLLRHLPYRNPDRLCLLWKSIPQRNIEWDWTSAPTIRDWREQSETFEDLAIILRPEGSEVTLHDVNGSEKLQASIVSGNFFQVLGAPPFIGRTFSAAEAHSGENVTVLSYGFWQRRFGASASVLGKTIPLDGRSVLIVGVMPPSFEFPDKHAALWLLLPADPRWSKFQMPQFRIADAFCAIGRLKPGKSLDQARAEMKTVASRLARQYPATDAGLGIRVIPLFDQIAGPKVRGALWTLGAAVLCVLFMACANVAGLLVARGAARGRELAVRAALGAGHWRLVKLLAIESMLLSLVSGIAGIALAYAGLHFLLALAPDLPRSSGIGINGTVLGFSFGLCLLTAFVFGMLPAWRIVRIETQSGLHDRSRNAAAGTGERRLRGVLVAAQFALAIVLLSGAGLLVRSFLLLNAVERGFDTARLLTVSVSLPGEKYQESARGNAFFDEAIQRLQALPGVLVAATGPAVLDGFQGNAPNQNIVVEGRPITQDPVLHARCVVSIGYFRLLGITLREGRLFSGGDISTNPRIAVVNESMAGSFWGSGSPLGKRFKQVLPGMDHDAWITVVGVVKDVIYNRDGRVVPVFYLPAQQRYEMSREILIRTAADSISLMAAVRREVQSIDPALPRLAIETVDGRLAEQDRPRRFQTGLIAIFASIALVLAAAGLYGLMAYGVERLTNEIGIRIALGSNAAGILRLVLCEGLAWGLGGAALGATGAAIFGKALSASLFRITTTDSATLSVIIAILALVTLLASAVPALRATRVDPAIALRHE